VAEAWRRRGSGKEKYDATKSDAYFGDAR
jgi:hypothetical protein